MKTQDTLTRHEEKLPIQNERRSFPAADVQPGFTLDLGMEDNAQPSFLIPEIPAAAVQTRESNA